MNPVYADSSKWRSFLRAVILERKRSWSGNITWQSGSPVVVITDHHWSKLLECSECIQVWKSLNFRGDPTKRDSPSWSKTSFSHKRVYHVVMLIQKLMAKSQISPVVAMSWIVVSQLSSIATTWLVVLYYLLASSFLVSYACCPS